MKMSIRSNKSGHAGKKTSEPQLNTYVRPVFTAFGETRMMETLRSTSY